MLVSGVAIGLVAGLAIGRSWRPLATLDIRWLPLLLAALAARAIAPLITPLAFPLYLFSLTGTAFAAAANARLWGASAVALGGAFNLAVVLANAGMPVDPAAIAAAAGSMPTDTLHVVLTDATRLTFFADVIPLTPMRAVYSVGDICIALGGFLVPFVLLIRR